MEKSLFPTQSFAVRNILFHSFGQRRRAPNFPELKTNPFRNHLRAILANPCLRTRRRGIGHQRNSQLPFEGKTPWQFRYNHGGILRKKRRGRRARPLSTRDPIHLVFKADKSAYKKGLRSPLGFILCQRVLKKHSRRSQGQHFFRVVAGQIAQEFQRNGLMRVTDTPKPQRKPLWRYRPFTRVIKGWRPYQWVRSYVRLNEKEASGKIDYKKSRLKGLSSAEWEPFGGEGQKNIPTNPTFRMARKKR